MRVIHILVVLSLLLPEYYGAKDKPAAKKDKALKGKAAQHLSAKGSATIQASKAVAKPKKKAAPKKSKAEKVQQKIEAAEKKKAETTPAPPTTTTLKPEPPKPYKTCPITEYYCAPNPEDMIKKVNAKNMDECYEQCKKEADCEIFTFQEFRGQASCSLLTDCSDKRQPCADKAKCASGYKSCSDAWPFCPKLTPPAEGSDGVIWKCGAVNPYTEEIPDGTLCYTECPNWTTKDGKVLFLMAICDNNDWTSVEAFPAGERSENTPSPLLQPDEPMLCPDADVCRDLSLTYDPNKEVGAEFYCIPPLDTTNATVTNPVRIDDETSCVLLCDRTPTSHLECRGTKWSGKPEVGFWCNEKKAPIKQWTW